VRSLLFQASLPPAYWADSLHTATYLLNRHPTKTLDGRTPYLALHGTPPSYTHLRVFGCACYPNLTSTAPTNYPLAPPCVYFSGIPLIIKGTDVSIFTPTGSSFLVTLSLTKLCFRSLRCPPPRRTPTHSISWTMLMILLCHIGQEL
jgi:hypothetical protein